MAHKNKILEWTMDKIKLIIILIVFSAIAACGGPKTKKPETEQQTMTITEQKQTSTLYFDGVISPIQTKVVTSPIEGSVEEMYFNYGQLIKRGQLLLKLKSSALGKNYQQAVSGYLTAKEKYSTSKSSLVGAKELYQAGITSLQTYQSAQNDLNDSYLSYLQAKQTIIDLFQSSGISQKDVYLLKIDDETAVRKALELPLKDISIYATMDGIALKPAKSADSGGGDQSVHSGSSLKADQVIVEIGKMSGIKININVDEISINKIKVGDPAQVTGAGFPGITLMGVVTGVSSQANPSDGGGGGLPTFPVAVAVEHITTQQQQLIHDGMSAKVRIDTGSPEEIIVPINAVKIINGNTFIDFVNPTTGKVVQQAVQTGQTTINGVQIISGLKPGDKIVVGD